MQKVFFSTVIDASIDEVWETISNFGKICDWHPLIIDCEIENGQSPSQVGCVRAFHLEDQSLFREKLLSFDIQNRSFSYSIVESPLPISNYVAKLSLFPITSNQFTFATWSSEFDCPVESANEMSELVENAVYRAGLDSVNQLLRSSE